MSKEPYSTRKAWGMGTETDAQVELFERLADGLRKEKNNSKRTKNTFKRNLPKKNSILNNLRRELNIPSS